MTTTDKNTRLAKIDRIEKKIKEAVAQIEKDEKITISFKGGKYDMVSYTPKIEILESSTDKKVVELHTRKNYNLSIRYGFSGNIVGMKFDKNKYEIVGFATRNRKYPVLYKEVRTGKGYKGGVSHINSKITKTAITRYNNLKELLED